MKSIVLSGFFAFIISSVSPRVCAQSFKKDYHVLDSITKNLSTYSFTLKTPYLTVSNPQFNSLPAYFKFLRKKKQVSPSEHPDFLLTIMIENIKLNGLPAFNEAMQGLNAGTNTERRMVHINVRYNLSLALNVITSSGYVYNIPLASDKDFTKKFTAANYFIEPVKPTRSPEERTIYTVDDQYAKNYRLPTEMLITDFYDILRKYKKGKKL